MTDLLRAWYSTSFEACKQGMPRRVLLDDHLNKFLAALGWNMLPDLHDARWNWFLANIARLPQDKIKGGRTQIKIRPRPSREATLKALEAFLQSERSAPQGS